MSEPVQENTAASAVQAATIVLARPAASGFEIFMVVRHHQIDFASGALVFPGGKIDPQDQSPEVQARLTRAAALDEQQQALRAGAIREAFEESGVLLARQGDSSELIPRAALEPLDACRDRIHCGELPFADFLSEHALTLAEDALVHFAHWITPKGMPKRFDTHFYLAVAPADQLAMHDGHESVDSVWITPQAVLEAAAAGTRTVIFPTLRNIELLAGFNSLDALVSGLEAQAVTPIEPWIEHRDDGNYVCIQEGVGYEITEERMPARG